MLVVNIITSSLFFRCIQKPQNVLLHHISAKHHSSHPRPDTNRKNTNSLFFAIWRQLITATFTYQPLKVSMNQWRDDAMLQVGVQLLLQHAFQIIHWRCWICIIPHMHTLKHWRRCSRWHNFAQLQNFSFFLDSLFNRQFTCYSAALICLTSDFF